MTTFSAAERTDVGRVRDANQDLAFVADDLFIVADGMGGHNGGETAAQVAVETVRDTFTLPTVDALVEAVQDANEAVVTRADTDPELQGMGTTICVVTSVNRDGDDMIGVASVGDSRVYLLADDHLQQVTRDHTLVQMLVDQGQLTEAEAERHPQRNILTRALGIDRRVMVDLFLLRPVTGDRYLICSDGLFGEVSDTRIVEVLSHHADPGEAAEELVRLANENGGRDNITCVVVDVVDGDEDAAPGGDRLLEAQTGATGVVYETEPRPEDADGADDVEDPDSDSASRGTGTDEDAGTDGDTGTDEDTGTDGDAGTDDAGAGSPADEGSGDRPRGRRGGGGRGKGRAVRAAAGATPSDTTGTAPRSPRRVTWRAPVFILLVLASLAVAVWAVGFYARNTYYVIVDADEEVVIYRGRPGGVLWFEPTVEERTGIAADDLTGAAREDLRGGKDEPTLEEARAYVDRLRDQVEDSNRAREPGVNPGPTTTEAPPDD